jgi:hypothetical protein
MEATNKSELFTDLSQEQSETVQGGCYRYGGGYYRPYYYAPRSYYGGGYGYYAPRSYYGGGYGCRRWYY